MHWEAVIERVRGGTWRPRSSELRAAVGGHDGTSLVIHFEAVEGRVWRCNWRPRLSELTSAK